MKAEEKIQSFLEQDNEKISEIIEKYPRQIPVAVVADLFGCHADSVRRALEQSSVFGLGFRQSGKLNRAFVIPTGVFVRWYLGVSA